MDHQKIHAGQCKPAVALACNPPHAEIPSKKFTSREISKLYHEPDGFISRTHAEALDYVNEKIREKA